jgi:outer membrane protein assembly factor BamB
MSVSTGAVDSHGGSGVFGAQSTPGTVDWWPMFHHDLNHSGYSTSTVPNTNHTIWSYTTGLDVWSSPAVAGGKVYVGSDDRSVYCLDASSGAKLWSYPAGLSVDSSPVVVPPCVYIGSKDGNVYCLNAFTGKKLWNYTTGFPVVSSPTAAAAPGCVYVGSYDYSVYCLDAGTGAKLWSYPTGGYVDSSPAVAYGKVYVGSRDGRVYCLDASSGAYIWSYKTGDVVDSSPAVAYGEVYVGSEDYEVYAFGPLIHDVAITNIVSPKTVVGQGFCDSINVTAANQGEATETFDVTLYANTTTIATQTITITNLNSKTITFTWNSTGFAKGNYIISAYAWPVPSETDIADNTFVYGKVQVAKKGDINADGSVDVLDLIIVAKALGTHSGDPKWNPNVDINDDGEVDVLDLILVAKYLGT